MNSATNVGDENVRNISGRTVAVASALDRRTVFVGGILFFCSGLLVLGLAYSVVRLQAVLLWLLIATIIASGLSPMVKRLERTRVWRGHGPGPTLAAIIVFCGLLVVLIILAVMVALPVSRQVSPFLQNTNETLYRIRRQWDTVQREVKWLPDLSGAVDSILVHVRQKTRAPGSEIAQLGLNIVRMLGETVTVLVLTLYMLLRPPRADKLMAWAFPERQQPRLRMVFARVAHKFQAWMRAQFVVALIGGGANFLGFLALGIPYPHLFGLLAGLGELIPTIGPVLAAIPAVFVALSISPAHGLAVVLLAFVVRMSVDYVLIPALMTEALGLPPIGTIAGVLAGFELFGLTGAVLALPVVTALLILIPEVTAVLVAPTPLSVEAPKADASVLGNTKRSTGAPKEEGTRTTR